MTSTEPFVGTLIGAGWEETQALGEDRAFVVRIRLDGPAPWPMKAVWQAWPVTVSRAETLSPTPDGVIKERGEDEQLQDLARARDIAEHQRNCLFEFIHGAGVRLGVIDPKIACGVYELMAAMDAYFDHLAAASTVQPPSSQESGVGETEGWVLVPREPTPWMIHVMRYGAHDAALIGINEDPIAGETPYPNFGPVLAKARYQAALDAAPRPSQREG